MRSTWVRKCSTCRSPASPNSLSLVRPLVRPSSAPCARSPAEPTALAASREALAITGRSSRRRAMLASAVSETRAIRSTSSPFSATSASIRSAFCDRREAATRPCDSSSRVCWVRNSRARLSSRLIAVSRVSSSAISTAAARAVARKRALWRPMRWLAANHAKAIRRAGTDQAMIASAHMPGAIRVKLSGPRAITNSAVHPASAISAMAVTSGLAMRGIRSAGESSSSTSHSSSGKVTGSRGGRAASSAFGSAVSLPTTLIEEPPLMIRGLPRFQAG